jgi:hypothetical protein
VRRLVLRLGEGRPRESPRRRPEEATRAAGAGGVGGGDLDAVVAGRSSRRRGAAPAATSRPAAKIQPVAEGALVLDEVVGKPVVWGISFVPGTRPAGRAYFSFLLDSPYMADGAQNIHTYIYIHIYIHTYMHPGVESIYPMV